MSRESSHTLDAFTLEILKSHLVVVAEEMFLTQGRTSKSPIIYEVLDYACALTNPRAELIAQANGVAGFLGALTFAVEDVLDKFGTSGLFDGDIVVTNIPYEGGGSHLSDVTMVMPIFHHDALVAFAVNKAHWTEVGGKDAGSMTNDATEIYQEGLQFPCIKIFERDQQVDALVDLIAANVRTPDSTLGDMYAQAAALRIGRRRVRELCERHGVHGVRQAMAAVLRDGRLRAEKALAAVPSGVYRAHDDIEDDGTGIGALPVQVEVTIEPGCFRVDFTGSGPEGHGTVNCTRVALMAAMRIIFTAIAAPRVPANEGLFQPLEVICPDRTVFTSGRPTPTSTYWEARLVASDLVWRALAEALPGSLTAGHYLSVCSEVLRTRNPETGEMALLVEPNAGGWGAGVDKDGEEGLFCMGNGQTYVLSTEVAETRYDVRVERYGFDTVRGGEGKHRGGRGLVREYRMLCEGSVTSSFGRSVKGAWGVAGGRPGTPNYVEVLDGHGSRKARAGKVTRIALQPGDLVRLVTGTGGGWGDPRERPREAVLEDLEAGLIDEPTATTTYGWIREAHA